MQAVDKYEADLWELAKEFQDRLHQILAANDSVQHMTAQAIAEK